MSRNSNVLPKVKIQTPDPDNNFSYTLNYNHFAIQVIRWPITDWLYSYLMWCIKIYEV